MRIAIDARELSGQATGVGRYLSEIAREWSHLPEARSHEFVFCAPGAIRLPNGAPSSYSVRTAPGHGTSWEQTVLPRLARDCDMLFAPGYSGPLSGSTPLVVAIHDVSFFAHPEWFRLGEGLRRRWVTRGSASRARRVLTISAFSAREISNHLGISKDRIEVIPPGITAPAEGERAPQGNAQPTVLFVGSIFNRRHVPELIEGFARLARRRTDARLAIVGDNRTFPYIDIERIRKATGVADRIDLLSYVSDEQLACLHRQARAFAFLSEYEGFAMTPAEALAVGVPPLLLDTPVAREVYGPAAAYVPHPDSKLIEPALNALLYDEAAREPILRAAPEVLRQYSWRECAARVLSVLLEAA